jgi:hypothetical protein
MKDLIVLSADKNAAFALQGALGRHESLGIRPIEFEVLKPHPGRDGGVRKSGPDVLALQRSRFSHALLVLDFEGCGAEATGAAVIEEQLNERLRRVWSDRAKAIVADPELDIWMWGADSILREAIDWPSGKGPIREWLRAKGFEIHPHTGKPLRPKEALEAALRDVGQPRSSSLYKKLAEKLSLQRCSDQAFQRLRRQLEAWFPRSRV